MGQGLTCYGLWMGLRGIGDTTEIELGIGWNWMVTRSAYTETSFLPSTKPIPCLQTGDCGILFNIFFSARILVCFGKIVFNWDFTRNLLMMSLSTFLWNLYVGLSLFFFVVLILTIKFTCARINYMPLSINEYNMVIFWWDLSFFLFVLFFDILFLTEFQFFV